MLDQLDLIMLPKPSSITVKAVDKESYDLLSLETKTFEKEEDYIAFVQTLSRGNVYIDDSGRVGFLSEGAVQTQTTVNPSVEEKVEAPEIRMISDREIQAVIHLKGVSEGQVQKFKIRGKYKKKSEGLVDTVDIDVENDLNQEDLQKVLTWVNEQQMELRDYYLEGPAYTADQDHIHNFSIGRICLDQLHASILDSMIEKLTKTRDRFRRPPESVTEMNSGKKKHK